ncbi:MAG: serine/threonine-protein kinase, partial [Planctomycetia bacterium]|nr:serine/threonine-protein kinase [Planctomycetia bacterium]
WLAGIAAGTAFLHDRGIVHRDLKPANIFRENGIVKIGDVGLSKFITPSRRSAQTDSVGTVYYMAPEVARGKYGSELDVYSLGIILYEMLTGFVPFSGESTGEILMKHLTEPPDLSKIPAQFRAVVGQALEKDPQRRTPGAARLLEEFRRAKQGLPALHQNVAQEIPASHFVDVPQLERNAVVKPGLPGAGARYPRNADAATAHYPPPQAAAANPFPRPQPPAPPVPVAREAGAASRKFGQRLADEIRQRPWLAIIIVIGFLGLVRGSPAGTVMGLGMAKGELLVLAGISAITFFVVKAMTAKGQAAAVAGPGIAGSPRMAPAEPVVMPRPAAPPAPPAVRPAAKKTVTIPTPWTVRDIAFPRRLSDLSGALTMAVVWGLLATGAVSGLVSHLPAVNAEHQLLTTPGGLGLFALTTIVGSWAVLLSSKLWEGTGAENHQRRLVQTALGAAVGALAFWLNEELLIDLPLRSEFRGIFDHVGNFPLTARSSVTEPSLAGFVLYFAALFGIRRWWLLADSYRSHRFRIASTLFTGFIAFMIPAAFVFQQNWGTLWGVAISTVVQLSATWTPPKQRPVVPAA